MPYPQLDRSRLRLLPLTDRLNRQAVATHAVSPDALPEGVSPAAAESIRETAGRMRVARAAGRPVMLTFGAHTIKNGLAPVLIRLMETGWLQHLATNGAGIIHDWEFAFQGKTSEDVRANVASGTFGMWAETGLNLNLAIVLGAYDGLGYGESVGRLIGEQRHVVPSTSDLLAVIGGAGEGPAAAERAAGAADALAVVTRLGLAPGIHPVPHPWAGFSVQAAAYRLGIPFTAHPMIGHDIIYVHPANHCAAIGRAAQRDFLAFAHQVSLLDGGVYLSVGSAVMSPMVFEKSLSMAQNLARQTGSAITGHHRVVVDLAEAQWDWSGGEPPADSPAFYVRYCKTFSRMGGTLRYVTCDNRSFLLGLARELGVAGNAQAGG
jgi:hypothetical protein